MVLLPFAVSGDLIYGFSELLIFRVSFAFVPALAGVLCQPRPFMSSPQCFKKLVFVILCPARLRSEGAKIYGCDRHLLGRERSFLAT